MPSVGDDHKGHHSQISPIRINLEDTPTALYVVPAPDLRPPRIPKSSNFSPQPAGSSPFEHTFAPYVSSSGRYHDYEDPDHDPHRDRYPSSSQNPPRTHKRKRPSQPPKKYYGKRRPGGFREEFNRGRRPRPSTVHKDDESNRPQGHDDEDDDGHRPDPEEHSGRYHHENDGGDRDEEPYGRRPPKDESVVYGHHEPSPSSHPEPPHGSRGGSRSPSSHKSIYESENDFRPSFEFLSEPLTSSVAHDEKRKPEESNPGFTQIPAEVSIPDFDTFGDFGPLSFQDKSSKEE